MAKVTSKLQLTVPKVIADEYGIKPGDELEWTPAGDAIRVTPAASPRKRMHFLSVSERLKLFRQMLERQRQREDSPPKAQAYRQRPPKPHEIDRGWKREDLYNRGRSR